MSTARKLATYDDLLAYPSEVKAEIFAGEIHVQPSALPGHSRAQRSLSHFIGGPFDDDTQGPQGWWILIEIDVRFGAHDVVRPDLVGWRRTRLPDLPHIRPIDVVPDWICEVLSPSTERVDRVRKQQLYARHGVPHYWLVDPIERVLEAYVLDGAQWRIAGTYDDTALARIPPFEAVELPVGRLFPPLPAPPT
ncbi:Uma2 family endonuclease [Nannocystis pusilla]|uniref:Uma2 family endonuclease n=1 Tax=Nannocystis pusilla TaxID=889268 RepID=UPI003BEFD1C4